MKKNLIFNTENSSFDDIYKLMVGAIVPRPIAWISTKSLQGEPNLAPFSFFTVASRNPATLMISIGESNNKQKGGIKDTLINIIETKEFVVNIVGENLVKPLYKSAIEVPTGVSEFDFAGVTATESLSVSAPTVLEAPIAFELVLDQIFNIGTDHVIFGEVKTIRIDSSVYLGDHKINIHALKPLASVVDRFSGITPLYKP